MRQPLTRAKFGRYGHSERIASGKSGNGADIEPILSPIANQRGQALRHLAAVRAFRRGPHKPSAVNDLARGLGKKHYVDCQGVSAASAQTLSSRLGGQTT